jgi:membrane-associated phospholipid phosphatase
MQFQSRSLGKWADRVAVAMPAILLAGFVIAWVGGGQLNREGYCAIQRDWFIVLNQVLNTWPSQIWSNLTLLGDATVLIPLLSPLILWRPQAWAAVLGAVPLASLLSVAGKHLAAMPRPAAFLDQHQFTVIGKVLTGNNSLPSGHSITIFAGVVAILIVLAPRSVSRRYWVVVVVAVLVCVVVGLSRIAVGAHWPLDVLLGGVCGSLAGLHGAALTHRYHRWWRLPPESIARWVVGALLLWSGLSLIKRALEHPSTGFVLLLAGLCGLFASVWLIKACYRRYSLMKTEPGNSLGSDDE